MQLTIFNKQNSVTVETITLEMLAENQLVWTLSKKDLTNLKIHHFI